MPRSGLEARQRLQQAALELFDQRGYDNTTAADIADRAGVNQRTFFRHFPDKREVLFGGQDDLRHSLIASVRAEPDDTHAVDVLRNAFLASAHVLEDNKDAGAARLRLIAETPALLERDLAKGAAMSSSLADALYDRGEPRYAADLVGTVCWATFHHAATQWIANPGRTLDSFITDSFGLLRASVNSPATPVVNHRARGDSSKQV